MTWFLANGHFAHHCTLQRYFSLFYSAHNLGESNHQCAEEFMPLCVTEGGCGGTLLVSTSIPSVSFTLT